MREFVYYSERARTSGNFKDLMSAGRLDIALHTIIAVFFLSNTLREDVKLHLIFNGPPDPPKHLEFVSNKEMPISKKDVGTLLKIMLYKYKKDRRIEVFPGCFIEKKGFIPFVKELAKENRNVYLLDERGEDIRKLDIEENPIFILGDQDGIPKKEKKYIKDYVKSVNVGPVSYFSSQVVAIVNNELDRRGI